LYLILVGLRIEKRDPTGVCGVKLKFHLFDLFVDFCATDRQQSTTNRQQIEQVEFALQQRLRGLWSTVQFQAEWRHCTVHGGVCNTIAWTANATLRMLLTPSRTATWQNIHHRQNVISLDLITHIASTTLNQEPDGKPSTRMPLPFLTIFDLVLTLTTFCPKNKEPATTHANQFKLSSLNVL